MSGKAFLCSLQLPQVFTSSTEARQFVFMDGSCLFPTKPKLRLSGGAVILAPRVPTGLGSCLDLINPVSGLKCWRSALHLGPLIKLPFAVTSLWGQCVVRWVKAHQNPSELVGHQRILALFNSYADREAKTCLKAFARAALYQALLAQFERNRVLAVKLADFHVGLAGLFCSEPRVERVLPELSFFQVVGRGSSTGEVNVSLWLHDGFARKLTDWLSSLRWYPSTGGGWTAISAVELLWQFVFDTGTSGMKVGGVPLTTMSWMALLCHL